MAEARGRGGGVAAEPRIRRGEAGAARRGAARRLGRGLGSLSRGGGFGGDLPRLWSLRVSAPAGAQPQAGSLCVASGDKGGIPGNGGKFALGFLRV